MATTAIRSAALAIVLGSGLLGGRCLAQPASISEGYRLAAALCARCHVIVASGSGSWTDAPAFESVANRPDMTPGWLVAFIQKPHLHMITDIYTPAQASSIASYILSLRRN
ncbi:c-type cytochrome [Limobrevibacterium gyesilva]|uniref:Cytochrome c n=1 Tax=Limobrevibacterium gyesilva TaxID=2991712 RepID=A0AA41YTZ9_9PROT|nr:cytochrome c [Limobrevibacterium gyesilva]MCW3475392.1 cytochrome c [Limobrevibacterium gyesilva]